MEIKSAILTQKSYSFLLVLKSCTTRTGSVPVSVSGVSAIFSTWVSEPSMMCGVFGSNQCVNVLQMSAFLTEGAV